MLNLEYLADLANRHHAALSARVQEFSVNGKSFDFNSRPYLMGVINLSPDSWYRESVCLNAETAVRRGKVLQAQGADLVDVGAESTLAHAARLDHVAQNSRLLPVVTGLREAGVLVSAETYEPAVAESVLKAGASVLNLTGPAKGDQIYPLVAEHDAALILCYVQGPNVREVGDFKFGADPVPMIYEYFARQLELATRCGVKKLILDPGLGFYYKNLQDSSLRIGYQLRTFLNTFRLRALGFPVCHALPHAFDHFGEDVRSAEPFFAVLAALGKTDLLRTHELSKVRAVLKTMSQTV